MRRSQEVTSQGVQSHHLLRTTVAVRTATLAFPRALELDGDLFREGLLGEEGVGVVLRMTALKI